MALNVILKRKRVALLQEEATQLRATQAGFAKRETDIAAQVEAATTEAEVAAASAAVAELEKQQKTTKERLETIKDEVDILLQEIDAAESAAESAASGGGDGGEGGDGSESAVRSKRSHNPLNNIRSYPLPWLERASASWQRRCAEFQRSGHMAYDKVQSILTRAALLSSDTIGPTGVGGINEAVGSAPSSLIDMVTVTDCTGMAAYKVAYEIDDIEAKPGTEGEMYNESEPTYGFVEFTPKLYNVITYISKFVAKFTPLRYEESIRNKISKALRAVVSKMAVTNLLASNLTDKYELTGASGNDLFTPNLLSDLTLSYGGDEAVEGEAVLILNKKDLKGFTSVRGANEFLPVYSYIPDRGSPSTGILKENNGLAVRYCINKHVPALWGATLTGTAQSFMAYGDPKNLEVALWGGFEVDVSKDYQFGKGLVSLRGDVNADAHVNTKHGFVVLSAKTP